ncbi:MAG: DUF2244 domain-containing protein [Rhizobiaceae bacterium]
MESTNALETPKADFHAILTPYRSLGPQGFKILMAILLGCWLIVGLAFLHIGAWPIVGFFGLDVLAIYLAFRFNYRSARQHEEVRLSRDELLVRKVAVSGKEVSHQFNPFWTKLSVARHPEIGVTAMTLASRQQSVRVGDFLNPDDRESFSKAFGLALARVKAG